MYTPPPPSPPFRKGEVGGLSLEPNFQKGWGGRDLTGPHLLERVVGKEGSNFFQRVVKGGGGCFNFHIKNKIKSVIFNDKKSL